MFNQLSITQKPSEQKKKGDKVANYVYQLNKCPFLLPSVCVCIYTINRDIYLKAKCKTQRKEEKTNNV